MTYLSIKGQSQFLQPQIFYEFPEFYTMDANKLVICLLKTVAAFTSRFKLLHSEVLPARNFKIPFKATWLISTKYSEKVF
jgi:hypothetical protein